MAAGGQGPASGSAGHIHPPETEKEKKKKGPGFLSQDILHTPSFQPPWVNPLSGSCRGREGGQREADCYSSPHSFLHLT